jgi:hypothetical protein
MASATRISTGVLGSDYRTEEVVTAACIALSVPVWLTVLLSVTNLDLLGKAREIDPGAEVPIHVKPVIDMDAPALKLGGKKVRAKMPKEWADPEPRPQPTSRTATPSTKASDDPNAAPPPDLPLNDAGPPPEDAGLIEDAATTGDLADADVESEGEGGGRPEGVDSGTSTEVNCETNGPVAGAYRVRIQRFFSSGVACGDVPAEEKQSCRPTASFSVSGGIVSSFSFNGCGNATIDAAAQAAASSKVGQSFPPVPELCPNLEQNSASVTYVCR